MKRFLLLTGLMISPVSYAALSPIENKLAQNIQQHYQQQVNFLGKIVDIQSGTMNQPGVKKVGKIIKKKLDKLGFKTIGYMSQIVCTVRRHYWQSMVEKGNQYY